MSLLWSWTGGYCWAYCAVNSEAFAQPTVDSFLRLPLSLVWNLLGAHCVVNLEPTVEFIQTPLLSQLWSWFWACCGIYMEADVEHAAELMQSSQCSWSGSCCQVSCKVYLKDATESISEFILSLLGISFRACSKAAGKLIWHLLCSRFKAYCEVVLGPALQWAAG